LEKHLGSEIPASAKGALKWSHWLYYKVFYDWVLVKASRLMFVLAGILLMIQIFTVIIDAVFRHIPGFQPFQGGGLELEELQMAMLTVMMIGYTWFLHGHIRIELFREKMKHPLDAIADAFAGACGLIYCTAAFKGILTLALNNFSLDMRTDMLEIPLAPFQMFFAILFLHFFLILVHYTAESIYRIFHAPLLRGEGAD
jgi:TRAP-type C4-dicarboxylate transport system permease small subunit